MGALPAQGTSPTGRLRSLQQLRLRGLFFSSWSGDGIVNPASASTTVNMTQARSVSASFCTCDLCFVLNRRHRWQRKRSRRLQSRLDPNYNRHTKIGYSFSTWSGSGVTNPSNQTTTASMTQNRDISASFTLLSYPLILTSGEGGSVTGSGTFSHGDTPTIVATPNTGYVFDSWVGAGVSDANSATSTISMISSRTATATFSAIDYTLSLVAQSGGSVSGGGVASYGEKIPINAIPDLNYTFLSWSGAGLDDQNSSSTFATITGDTTITAIFVVKTSADHSLVLSSSPSAGGIAVGSGSYSPGTTVTISANPLYRLRIHWLGRKRNCRLELFHDLRFAFFRQQPDRSFFPEILLSVSGHNRCRDGFRRGLLRFRSIYSDFSDPFGWLYLFPLGRFGCSNPSVASTTVSMSEDRNLTAVFSPKSYSVVLENTEGGVASGSGTFTHGSVIDINASAQAGFEFAGWTGGSVADSNSASTQVTVLSDLNPNLLLHSHHSHPPTIFRGRRVCLRRRYFYIRRFRHHNRNSRNQLCFQRLDRSLFFKSKATQLYPLPYLPTPTLRPTS